MVTNQEVSRDKTSLLINTSLFPDYYSHPYYLSHKTSSPSTDSTPVELRRQY